MYSNEAPLSLFSPNRLFVMELCDSTTRKHRIGLISGKASLDLICIEVYSKFKKIDFFFVKIKFIYRRSRMKVSVLPSTTSALALLKCCDVVCCFSISARKNEIQASAAFLDLAVSLEHEIWSEKNKPNFKEKLIFLSRINHCWLFVK